MHDSVARLQSPNYLGDTTTQKLIRSRGYPPWSAERAVQEGIPPGMRRGPFKQGDPPWNEERAVQEGDPRTSEWGRGIPGGSKLSPQHLITGTGAAPPFLAFPPPPASIRAAVGLRACDRSPSGYLGCAVVAPFIRYTSPTVVVLQVQGGHSGLVWFVHSLVRG